MEKVLVALSGGVDSAVSVHLLQRAGYEVTGYTFLTSGSEGHRATVARDAKAVANFFQIPHLIEDIKDEFEAVVVNYFVAEYAKGRTPNPCVYCNHKIKFPKLLARADNLGIAKVATGHYVKAENGILKKAADPKKDQSYVLCLLNEKDIHRFIFPLESYSKSQIRAIAADLKLPVANKGDSQEICFVPHDDYPALMRQYPHCFAQGDFLDCGGKVLGRHKGLPFYTLGQRRGIGLALGKPMYVTRLDEEKNAVYLGEEKELYTAVFQVGAINFLKTELALAEEFEALVKIRYLSEATPCRVKKAEGKRWQVTFNEPQKSVTPGQFAVFYDGDVLLGGGAIEQG